MIRLPDSRQLQRLSAFAGDTRAAWRLFCATLVELAGPTSMALVLRPPAGAPRLVALSAADGSVQVELADPFDAGAAALALAGPRADPRLAATVGARLDLAGPAPCALAQLLLADVALTLPLYVGGRCDHLLLLGVPAGHALADVDLALVEVLANVIGAYLAGALDRNRLVEEARRARTEIDQLAEVQRRLLPENPSIRGLDYAIHYQPSAVAGGDYYDLMRLSHRMPDYPAGQADAFGLMLADVSGHGAGAAMEAVQFDAILRTYQGSEGDGPAGALTYANRHFFSRRARSHFMTAQGLLVLPHLGEARLCNAGHLPPLRRRGDRIERLDGSFDIPIGILREHVFHNHVYDLVHGDLMLFYTDGITEARDRSGAEFGIERLQAVFARPELSTPAALLGGIVAAVHSHQGSEAGNDDQTLIVLQLSGPD